MTKRRQTDEESERDVKRCLTEMRNKEAGAVGGGARRYDNRFTTEAKAISILNLAQTS